LSALVKTKKKTIILPIVPIRRQPILVFCTTTQDSELHRPFDCAILIARVQPAMTRRGINSRNTFIFI